jgi:hypothetical protein
MKYAPFGENVATRVSPASGALAFSWYCSIS